MSRPITNLSFSCPVRGTNHKYLTGTYPLKYVGNFESADKKEQYLSFYNLVSKKTMEGGKPLYEFTQQRNLQTVFVLDFDKCSSEEILESFEEFNAAVGGKAELLASFSGYHVLYVVEDVISEEGYRCIQDIISNHYFNRCLHRLDKHSSFKVDKGFYHSQHWKSWIERDMINVTETTQKKNGIFKNITMKRDELLNVVVGCGFAGGVEENSLAFLYGYLMRQMSDILQENTDKMLSGKEKGKYSESTQERTINSLGRILADIEGRKSAGLFAAAYQRAPKERYKAVYSFIKSCFGYECSWSKAISEISSNVVRLLDGRREEHVRKPVESTGKSVELCGNEGNTQESPGCSDSVDNGHEAFDREGFYRDCSTKRVLEFVQSVEVLCRRGEVDIDFLGNFLSTNSIRSNSYWDIQSEKSDFSVFFGILRQVLDSTEWLPVSIRTTPISQLEWFRYVEMHTRNSPTFEGRLRKVAYIAANGFRLYSKIIGKPVELCLPRFALSAAGIDATEFLSDLKAFFESDKCPSMSKDNKQTVARFFREEIETLKAGSALFLDFLKKHSLDILNGEGVNIGAKDFEEMFQVNSRAATAFRLVFMEFLSTGLDREYVPLVRKRSYKMNKDLVSKYVNLKPPVKVVKIEDLPNVLGNGNTWNAISLYTKGLVINYGVEKAVEIWQDSLDRSCANDKERRKKESEKFARLVALQQGEGVCLKSNRQTA